MRTISHQYFERATGQVRTERLYSDGLINFIYSSAREHAPTLFRALTSARASAMLGSFNYDMALGTRISGNHGFQREIGVNLGECLDPPEYLNTARRIFERKIRYWECRPMPEDNAAIVSPADARVLVGSLNKTSGLFIKEKFFSFTELLGCEEWLNAFRGGDFAIFRLTPDKYHYNHAPVAGRVVDFYEIEGQYHSCNPSAVVALATPYSKNKRIVTIINTDVPGGTGAGLVAMIEIVAMMIGGIEQVYSERNYENPQPVRTGLFVKKGQPKSLYRPGSSTDVLIFQPERVRLDNDLLCNMFLPGVQSRFSAGFGRSLVETEVAVRERIAEAVGQNREMINMKYAKAEEVKR